VEAVHDGLVGMETGRQVVDRSETKRRTSRYKRGGQVEGNIAARQGAERMGSGEEDGEMKVGAVDSGMSWQRFLHLE
jgi:hypothetical protein